MEQETGDKEPSPASGLLSYRRAAFFEKTFGKKMFEKTFLKKIKKVLAFWEMQQYNYDS